MSRIGFVRAGQADPHVSDGEVLCEVLSIGRGQSTDSSVAGNQTLQDVARDGMQFPKIDDRLRLGNVGFGCGKKVPTIDQSATNLIPYRGRLE